AVHALHDALRQAGVTARTSNDGDACTVDADDAITLARVVREGLREPLKTIEDLTGCLRAHDLGMEEPCLTGGKVELGDVSVPVAAQLAVLLGASPEKVNTACDETNDLARWAHGERVGDLLTAAFRTATGHTLVDYLFHPDCLSCRREMALTLGRIGVDAAQRLVKILQYGP
ncbi:hypothetical protein KDA82_27020, partial [Streptomyces daliensis]|nr:hypothetical protein [Streptomyces daliensis]